MAILPVSSLSFRSNYNNLGFEGGKDKKSKTHSIPISHKLAVPLAATVLSMTPAPANSMTKLTDNYQLANIEQVDDDGDRVVARTECKDVSPSYGSCEVEFMSNDGNDSDAEYLNLCFNRNTSYNKTIVKDGEKIKVPVELVSNVSLRVDTLLAKNILRKYSDGKTENVTKYYVIGPSSYYKSLTNKATNENNVTFRKELRDEIEIYESFYDALKETCGNDVQYKYENVTENKEDEDFIDMIF